MPRNGTGTYTLPVAAFTPGAVIISGDMNSNLSDIGIALTQSLATTGVSTMTGPVRLANGSVTAPSLTFNGFNGTGFYRGGANILGIAVSSVSVGVINASATAIWGYDFVFSSAVAITSVIGVSGGLTTSTTITGGLVITGGLAVGFNGVPSIDQIQLGDANLVFDFDTGTMPRLQFDSSDFFGYRRSNDRFRHSIGGTTCESLSDTRLYYPGKIQLPEITVSTTASAAANQAWIYTKDNSGTSRVVYRNEDGAETFMGGPGSWEEIDTFTVTTSVASVNFSFSANYSRILIVGVSVSPSSTTTNAFIAQAYNSDFIGQPFQFDGVLLGSDGNGDVEIRSSNGGVIRDSSTWSAQTPGSFTIEYINTNNIGYKGVTGYGTCHGEDSITAIAGFTSTTEYTSVNTVTALFFFGNIYSGTFTVYGQIAT